MSESKIPHEAVEGLMRKAFVDESVSPELFWDALLNANLTIPLAKETQDESPSELPMLLGKDAEDEDVIWLFTSPQTMREYIEQDLPFRELPSVTVFSKIQFMEHEVLLIGPENLTLGLHPELVDTLAQGKVPEFHFDPAEKDESKSDGKKSIQVGAPQDDTKNLEKKFIPLFKSLPEVLEASFIQITDNTGSRLLLGVHLESDSRDNLKTLAQKVAHAAEGALPKGKTMDITLIQGSLKEAFVKWGKVFYKRS